MYPQIEQFSSMQSGELFVKLKTGGPMRQIGYWKEGKISVETDDKAIPNYVTPGGGNAETLVRIKKVGIEFTFYNLNPENMAFMLYGTTERATATTVTDEVQTVYANSVTPLAGLIDTSYASIAVKSEDGLTTYVKDTDYYVETGGIVIPSTGALATLDTGDGVVVKVTYKTLAADVIQALIHKGKEYAVRFISQNEARGNNPEICDMFRVKFSPTKELTLVDDDFKAIKMEGEILSDPSRDFAGGLSQHLVIYRNVYAA